MLYFSHRSRLSRVHVTPRKTLFTPSHAPVDLALLAPGRMTRKNYLYGGTLTLCDTWLANVKGRDTEEWVGETVFDIEVCARAPAQSIYVQGSSCTCSGDLDPSHASPAFQAEENVVCNFNCMTTQLVHGCHYVSRRPREARDLTSKIRSCTVRSDLKNKAFSAVVLLIFKIRSYSARSDLRN